MTKEEKTNTSIINSEIDLSTERETTQDNKTLLCRSSELLQMAILEKLTADNLSVSDIKSLSTSLKDAIAISQILTADGADERIIFELSDDLREECV